MQEANDKIIEQEVAFKYLGVKVTSDGKLEREVKQEANNASHISGYQNGIIWNNMFNPTRNLQTTWKGKYQSGI